MKKTRYAIGIDLGGTAIKYGICSREGEIVREFSRPTHADSPVDAILEHLIEAAEEALAFARSQGMSIDAIGLGTPGSVDVEEGFLKGNTPNFKHWRNVPIKRRMEDRLQIPVFVDNDANVMAFGEARFGAGQGSDQVVCITLGTGIGGGVIIDGKLFRGSMYAGAELGHMSICYNGHPCRCGGVGCWERYASATAMIEHYAQLNPDDPVSDTRTIFERYHASEPAAQQVVETEIRMVAVGIANLINIFNPRKIIIGGGVSEAGDWFVERIAGAARERAMEPALENLEIVRATLGNKAGWLGAAAFALSHFGETSEEGLTRI